MRMLLCHDLVLSCKGAPEKNLGKGVSSAAAAAALCSVAAAVTRLLCLRKPAKFHRGWLRRHDVTCHPCYRVDAGAIN